MTSISTKLSLVRDHYVDGVLGKEIFPKITSIEHTDNPIAKVSDFFLRKATKTLDAICVLCETGFVEDALVLRARPETSLDIEACWPGWNLTMRVRYRSANHDGSA